MSIGKPVMQRNYRQLNKKCSKKTMKPEEKVASEDQTETKAEIKGRKWTQRRNVRKRKISKIGTCLPTVFRITYAPPNKRTLVKNHTSSRFAARIKQHQKNNRPVQKVALFTRSELGNPAG